MNELAAEREIGRRMLQVVYSIPRAGLLQMSTGDLLTKIEEAGIFIPSSIKGDGVPTAVELLAQIEKVAHVCTWPELSSLSSIYPTAKTFLGQLELMYKSAELPYDTLGYLSEEKIGELYDRLRSGQDPAPDSLQ